MVDFQHVFHGRHKGGVGVRRDDPLFLQMGLERVFFNVRPIVLSLAQAFDFALDDRAFQQFQSPTRPPLRWFGTGECDQLGFGGSIENALSRRGRGMLADQGGLEPFLDQSLTGSSDCIDAGVQGFGDLAVAPSAPSLGAVRLQQNARSQQLERGVLARLNYRRKLLALFAAQRHDIPLDRRNCSLRHESPPVLIDRAMDSDFRCTINDGQH